MPYLEVRLDERFKRLSTAFASFRKESYKAALRQFELGIARVRARLAGFAEFREVSDAGAVVKQIWPDSDLSFRCGPVYPGRTFDPAEEIDHLFQRYVVSQYERPKEERRSNEEVWAQVYRRPLLPVTPKLEPHEFRTDEFVLEIPHAFKNGAWNALQPLSFDLTRPEHIQRKAALWYGNVRLVEGHPDLGKIYFLLGRPEDSSLLSAYYKAKNILHKLDVSHELVEEDEALEFGEQVVSKIQAHDLEEEELSSASP